jgi:AcrR family transcriptional regulator
MTRVASELIRTKGVNATTIDDVLRASGTSRSQFYQYFGDKESLVNDVAMLQSQTVLAREISRLRTVESLSGLRRWRDALVQQNALQNGAYGCIIGSIANEIADQNETARETLARTFSEWEALIDAALRRMQDAGNLSAAADVDQLTVGLMAALQGGYLLAQTSHDIKPMEVALDLALAHIAAYATP